MAEVKIDNGYVEVYETGRLRCRVMGGAYVTENDVTLTADELRIRSGGSTHVYDLDGRPMRVE